MVQENCKARALQFVCLLRKLNPLVMVFLMTDEG